MSIKIMPETAVTTLIPVERYNYLMSELEDRLDEQDLQLVKDVQEAKQQYRKGQLRKFKNRPS
jgi:hypothetical protein